MAGSYNAQSNPGAFVPTTNIWDVQQLQQVDIKSPEFKELLVRLYQNVNNIAIALNLKDTGYYTLQEFLNSQLFFPNPSLSATTSQNSSYRQVFRTVVNFGLLPNNSTKSLPHNINVTQQFSFTRIYGVANNMLGTSYIPIPYASSNTTDIIELYVDNVNVNITTGTDQTSYTTTYIILEYIKQ